jgi:hypothetical protein
VKGSDRPVVGKNLIRSKNARFLKFLAESLMEKATVWLRSGKEDKRCAGQKDATPAALVGRNLSHAENTGLLEHFPDSLPAWFFG